MAIIRRNGVLVREELAPEAQPTSPAAASALGANPDSAKMYGSGAQKQAVVNQAVDASTTLSGAQRYNMPRQATSTETLASTKAQRLSQLKGLGTRVEDKVRAQLEAPTASATLQLDPTKMAAYSPEEQGLINQIASAATPEAREAAMVGLANARGTDITQVQTLVQDLGINLAEQGKQAIGLTQVTLDDAILQEFGGAEQVAADMGITPDQLAGMTVEDFEKQLSSLESKEFSKIESLQAELRTASPIRQQEIMEELKALGAAGTTGAEASVATLEQQIEDADKVMFGGAEYELADLLGNDAISNAISSSVSNPADLEALRKTEPGLAAWIEANKADLANVVKEIETSQKAVQATTETLRSLTEGVNKDTLTAFGIDTQFMTAAELADVKSRLEGTLNPETGKVEGGNGAWQVMKSNPAIGVLLNKNPALISTLVKKDAGGGPDVPMTSIEIADAYNLATLFKEEGPNNKLLNEIVPGVSGDFITDPEVAAKVKGANDVLVALDPLVLKSDEGLFIDLIKSGELTPAQAMDISTTDAKELRTRKNGLRFVEANKNNLDALLSYALGIEGVSAAALNEKLGKAKKYASIDPKAKQIYDALKQFDSNGDGKIDNASVISTKIQNLLGVNRTIDQMSNLQPGQLFGKIQETLKSNFMDNAIAAPDTRAIALLAGDGKIDSKEMEQLSPEQIKKAMQVGLISPKDNTLYNERATSRARTADQDKNRDTAYTAINTALGKMGSPEGISFDKSGALFIDPKLIRNDSSNAVKYLGDLKSALVGAYATSKSESYKQYINGLLSNVKIAQDKANARVAEIDDESNRNNVYKDLTTTMSELEVPAGIKFSQSGDFVIDDKFYNRYPGSVVYNLANLRKKLVSMGSRSKSSTYKAYIDKVIGKLDKQHSTAKERAKAQEE